MTELKLWQVDAFADRPFTGNPAAVMPLDAWLDDSVLQSIAAENNLAETAFLVRVDDSEADYELCWFTPTSEVAMCGHATLASGHILLGQRTEKQALRFRTRKAGILEVARAGNGYRLDLPVWRPEPAPLTEIVAALEVDPATVAATLYHPERYSVVVLQNEAQVRACAPDFRALAAPGDWLTVVTAPGKETDVVSRAFAPGAGIDEDPVTGSAHAVIAAYWTDRLGRTSFTAYQASARGGHVGVELIGDRVILTGRCVTVIEGTMRL